MARGYSMKWYLFDENKGSRQKRPPLRKLVLVRTRLDNFKPGLSSDALAVGYRKNGAGDKQSPYFVVPGIGGRVIAWCDCLPQREPRKNGLLWDTTDLHQWYLDSSPTKGGSF